MDQPDWARVSGLWPLAIGTGQGAKLRQPVRLKVMMPTTTLFIHSLLRGRSARRHKLGAVRQQKVSACVCVCVSTGRGGGCNTYMVQ